MDDLQAVPLECDVDVVDVKELEELLNDLVDTLTPEEVPEFTAILMEAQERILAKLASLESDPELSSAVLPTP